jgi:type II secretory pathway pseudopilin PulG
MLAMSGNTYLEIIIASSIFVPLTIVAILAWIFLHGAKNDPDEQRLRKAQQDHQAAQRRTDHR